MTALKHLKEWYGNSTSYPKTSMKLSWITLPEPKPCPLQWLAAACSIQWTLSVLLETGRMEQYPLVQKQ